MSTRHADADSSKGSVIVVGGSGGMSERYRAIVEERGLELRHFENRVPTRRGRHRDGRHGLALAARPGEGPRRGRRARRLSPLGVGLGAAQCRRVARDLSLRHSHTSLLLALVVVVGRLAVWARVHTPLATRSAHELLCTHRLSSSEKAG